MNAKTVRKLKNSGTNEQLKQTLKDIKREVKKGYDFHLGHCLTPRTVSELKKLGFTVEYFDTYWGDGHEISWSEPKPRRKKFLGLF